MPRLGFPASAGLSASTRRYAPSRATRWVVGGAGMAGLPRTGIIIAVMGEDGGPPYLVRWTCGDYEPRISPCPDARGGRLRV